MDDDHLDEVKKKALPMTDTTNTTPTSNDNNDNMDVDPIDGGPRPVVAAAAAGAAAASSASTPSQARVTVVSKTGNPGLQTSLRSVTDPTMTTAAAAAASTVNLEEAARQAIERLRGDDLSARVQAAYELDLVASVLGAERTRDVRFCLVVVVFVVIVFCMLVCLRV